MRERRPIRVFVTQNASLYDHLAHSTYLNSITKHLAMDRELEVTVIPLKGSTPTGDMLGNAVVREVNGGLYTIRGNLTYFFNLFRELLKSRNKIEIIHCLPPNFSLLAALCCRFISPKTRVLFDLRSPWIEMSMEREKIPKIFPRLYISMAYLLERLLLSNTDGIIFITEGLRDYYNNKINILKVKHIICSSGYDPMLFSFRQVSTVKKMGEGKRAPTLGYDGVISKMRRLDFLLNALKFAKSKDMEYRLTLIGDGNDELRLKHMADQLGISSMVTFRGRVDHKEVSDHLKNCDAAVCHLPDLKVFEYCFPFKILEYLACGLPVLASDIPAHREISRHLDLTLYDPVEVDDFHEKLVEAFKRKKDIDYTTLEEYSWENIAKKIKKFYVMLTSDESKH